MTASWERVLEESKSCAHFLEFDRPGARRNGQSAGRFLGGTLRTGGVAVAIASASAARDLLAQLARMGCDPVAAMQQGNFVLVESTQMLARFVRRSVIDPEQFDRTVGAALRAARQRAGGAPLRAFGDMVGVLWRRGDRDLAVELERMWIALQQQIGFALFCTYHIDVFSPEFSMDSLHGVFENHTHVFPSGSSAELGRALDLAMDDVLGSRAPEIRSRMDTRAPSLPALPKPENLILSLRSHLPEVAGTVLERARELYDVATPRVYLRQEHSSC